MTGTRAAEADLTYNDRRQAVETAIEQRMQSLTGQSYVWVCVVDMTDTWAVYRTSGDATWQVEYSISDGGVTVGEPVEVRKVTSYEQVGAPILASESAAVPAVDHLVGRVLETKSNDAAGNRIFRVRIIAYGDSKNRRRYPEAVMRQAASLYEGAKAFDHHRTDEELATSTVQGLCGTFRNVEATAGGLDADLVVLASSTHVAESLDQSLANQADGLDPLVGLSHDVLATFKPVTDANGERLMEATQIVSVLSADVVADPAAGGQPTRALAGGIPIPTPPTKETTVPDAPVATPAAPGGTDPAAPTPASEATQPTPTPAPAPAPADRASETFGKGSLLARIAIDNVLSDVADAGLRSKLTESVVELLPDRFSEANLVSAAKQVRDLAARFEVAGLKPSVPDVKVVQEATDKKGARLQASFDGDFAAGYRSLKEAYADITGYRHALDTEDLARSILESSLGFHSDQRDGTRRASESADTSTWAFILGDAITRRMVKEYNRGDLQKWRKAVSSIVPVLDFRTQRIDRLGGYGVLPTVAQGAPYQPLTTPGNEEASYALGKKGGTEDLTMETIANDDMRLVVQIPQKLGRAAARSIYRDVLDIIIANATCTYDSTALFAAGHANTAALTLSQANLSAIRKKMRTQQAFGDAYDDLEVTPKFLWVPPSLEELAFELCTSAVAVGVNAGTAAGANISNLPNLHQGLEPVVVDYWEQTSSSAWFVQADPADVPTIEVGYFSGRQEPELFVQDSETVGSKFDRDAITWKIRFIYGLTTLDHRGFQRGNS
jgi:hypothetical protein